MTYAGLLQDLIEAIGFNPCCCGFWSVTFAMRIGVASDTLFQSLLLWILVCDIVSLSSTPEAFAGFQSLLLWILVCDTRSRNVCSGEYMSFNPCCCGFWSVTGSPRQVGVFRLSFNPCCCGFWSVTRHDDDHHGNLDQFQSLLLWILVCDTRVFPLLCLQCRVSIVVVVDFGL